MAELSLPDALIASLREGRMLPFVGAGVSLNIRRNDGEGAFPSWVGLLERAAARISDPKQSAAVTAMLGIEDYMRAGEYARSGLGGEWTGFLDAQFDLDPEDIDPATLDLPRAIWALGSQLIITTNYDLVLRWSCPRPLSIKEWQIQAVGGLIEARRSELSKPVVWHLHGSVSDTEKIILSPDGYARLYGSETQASQYEAALESLRALATTHALLFIGFSMDDEFLTRQLEWVAETFRGCAGPHFVLARARDVPLMKAKVVGLDIRFVEFEEFGEPLLRLVRSLVAAIEPGQEQPQQLEAQARAREVSGGDAPEQPAPAIAPVLLPQLGPEAELAGMLREDPKLRAAMANGLSRADDEQTLAAQMLAEKLYKLTWRFKEGMAALRDQPGSAARAQRLKALYEESAVEVSRSKVVEIDSEGFYALPLTTATFAESTMAATCGRSTITFWRVGDRKELRPRHAVDSNWAHESGLKLAEKAAQMGAEMLDDEASVLQRALGPVNDTLESPFEPGLSVNDQLERIARKLRSQSRPPVEESEPSHFYTVVKGAEDPAIAAFARMLNKHIPRLRIIFSLQAEAKRDENDFLGVIEEFYTAYEAIEGRP